MVGAGTITKTKQAAGAVARPVEALEFYSAVSALSAADRIDRGTNTIRDVKIAGLVSRNPARMLGLTGPRWGDLADEPYEYSPDALRQALPLYEGQRIYLNHPPSTIDPKLGRVVTSPERDIRDYWGRAINVRFVDGDGLRGDIEFLASHPMTPQILETAERMPDQLALSHRVVFHPVPGPGRVVIARIEKVRSIDLITDEPGTTHGLFESMVQPMAGEQPLPVTQAAGMATEDDAVPGAAGGEMGSGVTGPDKVKEGIAEMCLEVIMSDKSAADKISALQPLLEQLDSLKAGGVVTTDAGAGDAAAAEANAADATAPTAAESGAAATSGAMESAAILENRRLKAELGAREALESAAVKPTKARVEALAAINNPATRKSLLDDWKKADGSVGVEGLESRHFQPRSGGAGGGAGQAAALPPAALPAKDFARMAQGGF